MIRSFRLIRGANYMRRPPIRNDWSSSKAEIISCSGAPARSLSTEWLISSERHWRETSKFLPQRSQGDKETRRQGDKETRSFSSPCLPLSLSPCLLVSLSPCLLVPLWLCGCGG